MPVAATMETARRVIEREIARHNSETGRRGQGMRGRSYAEVLDAGLAVRIRRQPTEWQIFLAGLIYTDVAVDRHGRVQVDGWTYGGPETQEALLRHHKRDRILLGRNPDDFSAPAIVWDAAGNLICEGIAPIVPGAYGSVDGARAGARNRKAARDAVAAGEAAAGYLDDEKMRATLAALDIAEADTPPAPGGIVAGQFGGKLRRAPRSGKGGAAVAMLPAVSEEPLPEDWRANFQCSIGFNPADYAKGG